MSPTEKQIRLVEEIAETLKIIFPASSKDFTKRVYHEFIAEHYEAFKQQVDWSDYGDDDDWYGMAWFSPLNSM